MEGDAMIAEPIRCLDKIKHMQKYLKSKDIKYFMLFNFAVNTGLYINNLLDLKVSDITINDIIKGTMEIHAAPNNITIELNNSLKNNLDRYIKDNNLTLNDYLFPGNKGKCLERTQVWRVLKESADMLGIENFGTLSIPKSWGYWAYKTNNNNLNTIMHRFNRPSKKATLRFIGILDEIATLQTTSIEF